MGLEAGDGSVWYRCHRFGGDGAVSIIFFCFLGGKFETRLSICFILHCNVRHGVGDEHTTHFFKFLCIFVEGFLRSGWTYCGHY
jgi:hypothetical protein